MDALNPARQCRVILLTDAPASSDSFETGNHRGPHGRVADAICEQIRSGTQPKSGSNGGALTIALEGSWGSGKSTIVQLIRQRLDRDQDYLTVEFDAWAHEGDPLRRTFLETLIEQLVKVGWLSSETAEGTKARVAKRVRKTSTNTTSRPTLLGFFSSFAILLIPFGATLISDSLRGGATYWPDAKSHIAPQLLIGTVFATAPFLVAIWQLVFYLIIWQQARRFWDWSRGNPPKRRLPVFNLDSWPLFARQDQQVQRSRTIESSDPTSVEFETEFRQLINEALRDTYPDRRLVLVMDNLDRVDPDDALKIWSTMQTFIHPSESGVHWRRQLNVIVPYDPNGIRNLWDRNELTENQTSGDQIVDTTQSFLDKSFQVRFRVPPPVLSAWQRYLDNLLVTALPDLSFDERKAVYRVFDLCRNDVNPRVEASPTPRQLKLFVNQLGALLRQWQFTFPADHVAYYVLNCPGAATGRDPAIEIRDGNLPGRLGKQLLGANELTRTVASLYFSEEPDLAMELALAPPINNALTKGDAASLKELATLHPDSFWFILQRIGANWPLAIAPDQVCVAAKTLADANLCDDSRCEYRTFREALKHTLLEPTFFKMVSVSGETLSGIGTICHLVNVPSFTVKIKELFVEKLSSLDSNYTDDYVDSVTEFDKAAKGTDWLEGPFTLPFTAAGWQAMCNRLIATSAPQYIWSRMRPNATINEVEAELVANVTGGAVLSTLNCLEVSRHAFPNHSWADLINALETSLQHDKSPSLENAEAAIIQLLIFLGQGTPAQRSLDRLVTQGDLLHQLARYKTSPDFCRLCGFAYLVINPDLTAPAAVPGNASIGLNTFNEHLNSTDANDASDLVDRSKLFKRPTLLVDLANRLNSNAHTLIRHGLCIAAQREDWDSYIPLDRLKGGFGHLPAVLVFSDVDYYTPCLKDLCSNGVLEQNCKVEGFQIPNVPFYRHVIKAADLSVGHWLPTWIADQLPILSSTDWLTATSTDFQIFGLLEDLLNKGVSVKLLTPFSDALCEHAEKALGGKELPPADIASQWQSTINCLDDLSLRSDLRRRIAEMACKADGEFSDAFFELYGDELSTALDQSSVDKPISRLLVPIVRVRRLSGLGWLVKHAEAKSQTISNSPEFELWKHRLRDDFMIEGLEGDIREIIRHLAHLTTVKLSSSANSESDAGQA